MRTRKQTNETTSRREKSTVQKAAQQKNAIRTETIPLGPTPLGQMQGTHCCSIAQSCPTLCDPIVCSTPGFPILHHLLELAQTHVNESVMPSNHLILSRPFLLLPSIFPSIKIFSNESALHIRWSKY